MSVALTGCVESDTPWHIKVSQGESVVFFTFVLTHSSVMLCEVVKPAKALYRATRGTDYAGLFAAIKRAELAGVDDVDPAAIRK